jgi:hypothetical protein
MLEPSLCPRQDNQIIREQKTIHTHSLKETVIMQEIHMGQGTQNFPFQIGNEDGK